mmetsp:Transcript_5114/g.7479  ORF Transcript_5114/g.7479 Transcript_5114/m.7479 type:complete len:311 (-) Transcript_5114:61-993(-)
MRWVSHIPAAAATLAVLHRSAQAQSTAACYLCDDKKPPCLPDKVVFLPGMGNLTCEKLGAGIGTDQCLQLKQGYAEECGCSNFFDCEPKTISPAPTSTAYPTMMASSAPSNPSCSICKDDRVCTNSMVQIVGEPAKSCFDLEADGFNGKISPYVCPVLQEAANIRESCGCNLGCRPAEKPSVNPTDGPVDLTTGKPSSSPSLHPSIHPSIVPSLIPSSEPSMEPSVAPSVPTESQAPSSSPVAVDSSQTPSASPVVVNSSDSQSMNPSMIPSSISPSSNLTPEPTSSAWTASLLVPILSAVAAFHFIIFQ